MTVFKTDIKVEDPAYENIRDGQHPMEIFGRNLTNQLWETFQPFSDQHFTEQLAIDFDARFWEMDLTVDLIRQGFDVSCPKPGPDVCLNVDERRVWIEAIAPKEGEGADKVPEVVTGEAHAVPNDRIILRYTSAIAEKYNKYLEYLKSEIIAPDEPFVIAINGCQIPSARADFEPPRIVRSVFPIGHEYLTVDKKSGDVVDSGFEFRLSVQKENGTEIPINHFINSEYSGISAIIFSCSDCCNRPKENNDWVIVHNPLATNPIASDMISSHREYIATPVDGDTYKLECKRRE
ncbi:hypothetical protein [Vibrio furnissii]|uniref:hypothetical protein n=1 Tax=Vibrio furnissii TaxID=29494 RepID=UPI003751FC25